ncbi:MAG: phosphoenolpyruvate mutase [Candidatus Pelagibacter sp.]|nr:phosphoenolpyruvate mutase [Candidatus Pelagibacter sp.]OUW23350.1 MAG: phosphoenolpyruvate mutase [Rickettsiales bacterium TMED174]|tara:strand:- start:102 stop:1391 length:1290 start_codon:yes stop_codon:yes gene_type:complete
MKKKVYVCLAADILHEGHVNILKKASKHGDVTVGLMTDNAIGKYKKIPFLNYHQREVVVKNLSMVKKVIPQYTMDFRPNLRLLKPDYVVHGDIWKPALKKLRKEVVEQLKKWSGKLIEYPYTKNISSSSIKENIINSPLFNVSRVSMLKRLLSVKGFVRIIEAHSPLAGLIIENTKYKKNKNDKEYDGMWSSSLTESLMRGKPDNQSVELSTRITALNELLDITTKPIIFDADNGGRIEHLSYRINTLERQGVSAIVIEDKIGLKKNSLFKNQKNAQQDSIKNFCKKLKVAAKSKNSKDFFIVARIESFILGKGLQDALKRAKAYSNSGADAILIHSKENNPKEIFKFSKIYKKFNNHKHLIAVPSSYSKTLEKDLIKNGFNIVIYANHMLRASYLSMKKLALDILKNSRSFESEKKISKISDLLKYSK